MESGTKIAWNGPILVSTACALNQAKTLAARTLALPASPKTSHASGVPRKRRSDAALGAAYKAHKWSELLIAEGIATRNRARLQADREPTRALC